MLYALLDISCSYLRRLLVYYIPIFYVLTHVINFYLELVKLTPKSTPAIDRCNLILISLLPHLSPLEDMSFSRLLLTSTFLAVLKAGTSTRLPYAVVTLRQPHPFKSGSWLVKMMVPDLTCTYGCTIDCRLPCMVDDPDVKYLFSTQRHLWRSNHTATLPF